MTRWGLKACVFLMLVAFISPPLAPTALLAADLPVQDHKTPMDAGPADLNRQLIGPEIAGAGVAGAGVGKSVNRVVVRNVLIGLALAGLWLFSALNEGS